MNIDERPVDIGWFHMWETGVNWKSLAAEFRPAVQRMEHIGQFPMGQLDYLLIKELIPAILQVSKKGTAFYYLIVW
jgi:hypothetical protein